MDIQQPLELCLNEYHFLYNVIWILENSGPIGLLIMVVLSECYLDDSHPRFNNRE